jgi:transcriptional regulator with XRE-family HTH domain
VTLLIRDLPSTGPEWTALREDAGLTIRDLAALTELSSRTLHALEAGKRVSRSTRKLVAAACGLNVFDHRDREQP